MVESWRMRWSGHVAWMGEIKSTNYLIGNDERHQLEDLIGCGRIILKWI
jgi:hypothetical protein